MGRASNKERGIEQLKQSEGQKRQEAKDRMQATTMQEIRLRADGKLTRNRCATAQ